MLIRLRDAMHYNGTRFSRTYACAFLNVYGKSLTYGDIEKIKVLLNFFKSNKNFYIALSLPSIAQATKEHAIKLIVSNFSLPSSLGILMTTLIKECLIQYADQILAAICDEYERRHKIINFLVESSHALSDTQQIALSEFIKKLYPNTTQLQFAIDPSLIVGIRIESRNLLWERSIRKKLLHMRQIVTTKGAL